VALATVGSRTHTVTVAESDENATGTYRFKVIAQ